MTPPKPRRRVTRAAFLRLVAATAAAAVVPGSSSARATAVEPDTQTVVDFDWSEPECPERAVGELEQYFFGDLDSSDGFHLDDGSGAADSPDGCVLRTDGDEVRITTPADDLAADCVT